MGALLETLTTPEAAVAAGVSVREVNRPGMVGSTGRLKTIC